MNKKIPFAVMSSTAVIASFVAPTFTPAANEVQAAEQPPFFQYQGENINISQIAQYDSGAGEGGTEILAYDENLKRAFVTNGAVIRDGYSII